MTTVKDLRKLAKLKNIKGYSRMKKDQLLRILDIQPSAKPKTVQELRKIAKERKIKGYYIMKKADLIDALRHVDKIINTAFNFDDSYFEPELPDYNNHNNPRLIEITETRSRFI